MGPSLDALLAANLNGVPGALRPRTCGAKPSPPDRAGLGAVDGLCIWYGTRRCGPATGLPWGEGEYAVSASRVSAHGRWDPESRRRAHHDGC